MDIIINGNLQIVFLNLPLILCSSIFKRRWMGGKAKSLTGVFKWECNSLDLAIKWRRVRLKLQYLCLFWGKPFEERHKTADEAAASDARSGKGEWWWEGEAPAVKRGLRGAVLALSKCAKSPHKGQAVDFMSGRNRLWHQSHLCESSKRLWA